MKKSELLEYLVKEFPEFRNEDLDEILDGTFEAMIEALANDETIEIRGLGSFKTKVRRGREARNPKTGERIVVPERRVVHFKMGKKLKSKLFSKNQLATK